MSKKGKDGYVKKETMMVVVFVALAVGFLGGVFYSAYKSAPGKEAPSGQSQVSNVQASGISELEKETALHPDNVAAWVQLGNLYFDANQVDKAISAYKRSLALDPDNPNVLTDLGVMYRRKGQPLEAIKAFDRAIQKNPRQEPAYFNKGVVFLHDLNDTDKAIKAWEELVLVNPGAKVQNGELVVDLIKNIKAKKTP
ncbi:MAG: tetratricopeptide repeat protein [Deltaproteobacteria bacterium]|jgi:tetratricopeptide (TPR) repeat protein|nr:tetratricopeptide repeat protein [Deltaproteobacteria bacterium]